MREFFQMTQFIAFSMPGGMELLFILLIVLLLFGAKKLPELARGLGKSVLELRKAKDEFDREIQKSTDSSVEVKESGDKQEHRPS